MNLRGGHCTIEELMAEGFSKTAIYYYIKIGLLPSPGRGEWASYSNVHVAILRRVKEAMDANRTLDDLIEEMHAKYPKAFTQGGKDESAHVVQRRHRGGRQSDHHPG